MWAFFELLIFTYVDIDRDLDSFFAIPCIAVFSHVINADLSPYCGLGSVFFIAKNNQTIKDTGRMNMIQQNWKRSFFTIWAGQAVSLITSSVLQMAIIWYLTDTTGSAMVLSMATMVGFLPQAILGTMIGVLVDRWNRKLIMIGGGLKKPCTEHYFFHFLDGDYIIHFWLVAYKWLPYLCTVQCLDGLFKPIL
ncbi:MAG: Antiporter protein [Paenibacillus sp.]|nr:Antiporter protein [Paenibacillus sp.]